MNIGVLAAERCVGAGGGSGPISAGTARRLTNATPKSPVRYVDRDACVTSRLIPRSRAGLTTSAETGA